ncbi:MAG: peptidoglycan-binding protein, partial [Gammaproteobacteria bacterium]
MVAAAFLGACAGTSQPKQTTAPKLKPIPATVLPVAPPEYRTDAPDRYVVKRGDTLWHIAGLFLKNPARWKEIWHANPKIKNPNKIYP